MASFLLRRRYAGWLSGAGSTVWEPPASGAISASTGATGSSLMSLTGLALTRLGFSPARAWNWLRRSRPPSRAATRIAPHRWPSAPHPAPEEARAPQDPRRDRRKIPPPPDRAKEPVGQRHPNRADKV